MNKKEGFNVGSQENSENTTNCTDDDSNLAQYLSILNREIMTCSEYVDSNSDNCEDISHICQYSCNMNECKYDIFEDPIICEINGENAGYEDMCAEMDGNFLIDPLEQNSIVSNDSPGTYLRIPEQYCYEHDIWFRDRANDQSVSCRNIVHSSDSDYAGGTMTPDDLCEQIFLEGGRVIKEMCVTACGVDSCYYNRQLKMVL